jgi:hypothetical protein
MTGRTQGTKEKPYRYYTPSSSKAGPSSDVTLRRTVPAEPIERAVLDAIQATLSHPNVRDQIVEIMNQQEAERMQESSVISQMKREQEKLQGQIEFVIEELGVVGKDAAKRKIQELETRLAVLNDRIASAQTPRKTKSPAEIELEADKIASRLARLSSKFGLFNAYGLRELIASMVTRLEVDLETRELTMEFALPSWAFGR